MVANIINKVCGLCTSVGSMYVGENNEDAAKDFFFPTMNENLKFSKVEVVFPKLTIGLLVCTLKCFSHIN